MDIMQKKKKKDNYWWKLVLMGILNRHHDISDFEIVCPPR